MRIPINRQNSIPLYQQIQNYLREQILSGHLPAGIRLPASRKLAQDLGVSRITVQNAYGNLESEGLIGSREGSGSFVMEPITSQSIKKENAPISWPLWQRELIKHEEQIPNTNIDLQTNQPTNQNIISFTGVGDPKHFPAKDFYKAMQTVFRNEGVSALEYGKLGAGDLALRNTITHLLASQGIRTHPEQTLITSGSQQALALICQVLLKPGDVILVEKPTYNVALDLFRSCDLKIVGVPIDENGLQLERLEPLLQQYHPRLLYTIPNFQNPSGVCMSGTRRRALIELAGRYNLPILEDDFVGDLRYNGRSQPAIKALDPGGRVIYVGTFSKMLMPGLRVGYLVADGPIFNRLVQAKQVTDLTTSTLIQRTLNEYVTIGRYQIHLRRSTRLYRKRRDAMLAAIVHHLPDDVQVMHPNGGLFVWVRLPAGISTDELLPLAISEGVEFAPGSRFFPAPEEGIQFLRLNFATQAPEKIDEGIRRLNAAIEQLMR
ncbi:MAG: PLP-dependent aminotransferase family protein [Chloroflexi bacterium]|nr:MAG: PLP-dependent aminotransferase family protein [Chloroflexota bacterium]